MIQETPLCTECAHVITNPMCPRCFAQHVLYWLRDKDLSEKQKVRVVKKFAKIVREAEQTPANMKCVVCSHSQVNLCTCCFIGKSSKVIKKEVKIKQVTDGFNEDFNCEIWDIEIK